MTAPAYILVTDLAKQLGTRADCLMPYADRADDPMPVRYLPGKKRYGFVIKEEMDEWIRRNSTGHMDR